MKIYLDNCCYNRPYDSQVEPRVQQETVSILRILEYAKKYPMRIVGSYILDYEIGRAPQMIRRRQVSELVNTTITEYVSVTVFPELRATIQSIMAEGVKLADAHHIACALWSKCDYFLSTDRRLLRYDNPNLVLLNPLDFIKIINGAEK